jgi:sugar phosphate isomerase/epimerase
MTLDFGHLELAGLDSAAFIRNMQPALIQRIRFAHIHHHDSKATRDIKDHRPLVPGCREIDALKELLQ